VPVLRSSSPAASASAPPASPARRWTTIVRMRLLQLVNDNSHVRMRFSPLPDNPLIHLPIPTSKPTPDLPRNSDTLQVRNLLKQSQTPPKPHLPFHFGILRPRFPWPILCVKPNDRGRVDGGGRGRVGPPSLDGSWAAFIFWDTAIMTIRVGPTMDVRCCVGEYSADDGCEAACGNGLAVALVDNVILRCRGDVPAFVD